MTSQTSETAAPRPLVELAVLNHMPSLDFETSLQLHREWGLRWVDLWGQIFGVPSVDQLDTATAQKAADAISGAGLQTYCLSTRIFNDHVEQGEDAFRSKHIPQLKRSLAVAEIVKPRFVRLIAARMEVASSPGTNRIHRLQRGFPWVRDVYREAIRTIQDAGFEVTIENETGDCFLSEPAEFIDFAEWLDLAGLSTQLTWDIQNDWQTGSFPSLEAYETLAPNLGYVHLKGGVADTDGQLQWRSGLAEASWPVEEITRAVVRDGVSPVICLNPSHGSVRPGSQWDVPAVTKQDIEFLRNRVEGIC